jgi:glycosyl hydrolase family 2
MTTATWDSLEVFFGDANNAEARIYARLPSGMAPTGANLAGRVVGPECAFAQTLSAAIRLTTKRLPPDESTQAADLLAEAIVPDPCFWSPELPFLYRVEVELREANELLAVAERTLGLRPLGARGCKLLLEGRPWVVRAVERAALPPADLNAWRAEDMAMIVEEPGDELCEEASRQGVWLAARIADSSPRSAAEFRRLARWPCVAMVILEAGAELPETALRGPRNVLLAQRFGPGAAIAPVEWADAIVCEDSTPARLAERSAGVAKPVIAQHRGRKHDDLPAARRACDELQRALAGRGEFTGYIA